MTDKPQREPSRLFKLLNPELFIKRSPATVTIGLIGTGVFLVVVGYWGFRYLRTGEIGERVEIVAPKNNANVEIEEPRVVKEWKRYSKDK